MMRMRSYTLAAASLAMAACGSIYNSEFQCPLPAETGGCRSLQQVYNQATAPIPTPPSPDPDRYAPTSQASEWTPPVKTVWIAPYLDSAGRRHEASLMRIVVLLGPKATAQEPEFLLPPIPDNTDGELLTPPAGPDLAAPAAREPGSRPAARTPQRNTPTNKLFAPPGSTVRPPTPPGFALPGTSQERVP